MEKLTFEMLPEAVQNLSKKLDKIESLLNDNNKPKEDGLLNVKEAAKLLNLSVPTIYGYVSDRKIPFMKITKRLYFSRTDLMDWVRENKRDTSEDIRSNT